MDGTSTATEPTETAPRRGRYAKSAAVRRAILQAAEEVFAERGFRAGSIREIADRVGMSETGLMHHARSKAALMLDVLTERDEWQQERMDALSTPAEYLAELLRIAKANMLEPGVTALYCVISAEATSPDHPAHEYFRERYEGGRLALADVFRALADEGRMREGADPDVCARTTLALMDGLQEQWLLSPDSVDIAADLRAYLASILDTSVIDEMHPSDILPRTGLHDAKGSA